MSLKKLIFIRNIFFIILIVEFILINYSLIEKIKNINIKYTKIEKRLSNLEDDYKLYEINLSNLKKNAKAHFCNN